jgi:hypothetical protein
MTYANDTIGIAHRWNIERDGDDLLVCEGHHHKSEGCKFVRYRRVGEPCSPGCDEPPHVSKVWNDRTKDWHPPHNTKPVPSGYEPKGDR